MPWCNCVACLRLSYGFSAPGSKHCIRRAELPFINVTDYVEAILTLTRNITIACALRSAFMDGCAE